MAKALIETAHRLADVLDRENLALKAMDLPRAAALLPEKTSAIAGMVASGEVPATPDPALVAIARRLERLASENRRLLERAIAAQQRLISIVVKAAAAVSVAPSYGSKGRRPMTPGPMAFSTRA
jgi:hypothetical protein